MNSVQVYDGNGVEPAFHPGWFWSSLMNPNADGVQSSSIMVKMNDEKEHGSCLLVKGEQKDYVQVPLNSNVADFLKSRFDDGKLFTLETWEGMRLCFGCFANDIVEATDEYGVPQLLCMINYKHAHNG